MKGVDFVRRDILSLRGYDEEFKGGVNLAANTNLFGTNPAIERALAKTRPNQLVDYPSLTSVDFRHAAARKLGVDPECIITGNGSNELIDLVMRTLLDPGDRVCYQWPTFSMIPIFVRENHGAGVPVALDKDWNMDVDAVLAAEAKITFVVRPNNPTGNAFPRRDVERLIHETEGIVVIDEAYQEFLGGESFVKEIREGNDRVIVLRTLSKAHGLAGLRVGYAVAGEDLALEIGKIRGPYRVDHLAEMAASIALADDKFVDETVAATRSERVNLKRALEARGFTVFPSDANFLLTIPPVDAKRLTARLAEAGVLVRDFGGDLAQYVRITVGPPALTARLCVALDAILREEAA